MKRRLSDDEIPLKIRTKVSDEKAMTREGRLKKREIRERRRKREREKWGEDSSE